MNQDLFSLGCFTVVGVGSFFTGWYGRKYATRPARDAKGRFVSKDLNKAKRRYPFSIKPRRYAADVAKELHDGLLDGTITLRDTQDAVPQTTACDTQCVRKTTASEPHLRNTETVDDTQYVRTAVDALPEATAFGTRYPQTKVVSVQDGRITVTEGE